MAVILPVLTLVLMIVALIDIITRDDSQVRYLPKLVWVLLVVILPLAGTVVWFVIGRERNGDAVRMPQPRPRPQSYARPTAPAPSAPAAPSQPTRSIDTRTTEEQLADLEREIEEWRLREEIAKRKQERGEDA